MPKNNNQAKIPNPNLECEVDALLAFEDPPDFLEDVRRTGVRMRHYGIDPSNSNMLHVIEALLAPNEMWIFSINVPAARFPKLADGRIALSGKSMPVGSTHELLHQMIKGNYKHKDSVKMDKLRRIKAWCINLNDPSKKFEIRRGEPSEVETDDC